LKNNVLSDKGGEEHAKPEARSGHLNSFENLALPPSFVTKQCVILDLRIDIKTTAQSLHGTNTSLRRTDSCPGCVGPGYHVWPF